MLKYQIKIDYERDKILNEFAMAKLRDNYLLPDERPQDMFARVACAYGFSEGHAQKVYDYISKQWFIPATPVLANGGADRGLPISCFLNEQADSLEAIAGNWNENIWLAAKGGGIGTYYGNIRSIGERVGKVGTTSGVIPFIKVQDSLSLCISQGSQRSGAAAVYLPINHPEIEEFLLMRRPTGGDHRRKAEYLHHGVVISDAFMEAVEQGKEWHLLSPKDGHVVKTVQARELWQQILTVRIETGEPYLLFIDNVNRGLPEVQKKLGLKVKTSNLCSEITLPTGKDHHGKERTGVCCLSSLNLEKYDEWRHDEEFIPAVMLFLDLVLQDFIDRSPDVLHNARYSAIRERSVGLGTMGFHAYLQSKLVPFESAMAKALNKRIFKDIKEKVDEANHMLGEQLGCCADGTDAGLTIRFSNTMAIAPNASTAIIANSTSPGIEPYAANAFTQKTDVGSFTVRNRYLEKLLETKGMNTADTWSRITTNGGSVHSLDFLTQEEKDVFKTAFEINQAWVVEHAADRTPYISQAQSLNVFLPADVDKKTLHKLHFDAWKKGVKSLYYCRSKAVNRAMVVTKYDEGDCLACQG